MWEREPAQDEGVHDRELRRHPANPEREHGDRENAKRLLLNKNAKADAEILEKRLEEHKRGGLVEPARIDCTLCR